MVIKNLDKLIFCAFSAIKAASVETQCVAEGFDASRTSQEKTVAQYVDDYWQDSRLRFIDKIDVNEIKNTLLKLPKWPGGEVIRSYEQLFWMISDRYSLREPFYHLLENSRRFNFEILTDFKRRYPLARNEHAILICLYFLKSEDQDQFVACIGDLNILSSYLLEAIKQYKKNTESFINRRQKLNRAMGNTVKHVIKFILENSLYHSFDTDEQREIFMQWVRENPSIPITCFEDLLYLKDIYCAFDNNDERELFIDWVNENQIIPIKYFDTLLCLKNIYCAFDNNDERERFMQWAKEISIMPIKNSSDLLRLKGIYCTFHNNDERNFFLQWPKKKKDYTDQFLTFSDRLIIIYKNPEIRLKFDSYYLITHTYYNGSFFYNMFRSFIYQDTIHSMRFTAALMAEPGASDSRIRSIKESSIINAPLPALNPEDPYMNMITKQVGFANVHSFETYCENDAATGDGSQNIEQRIANTPIEAERIFKAVKDSARFIELYTESDKPELFELYLCYYDALYQGKTIIDADGNATRVRDENVLERDALGNMVRRYHSDGSLRANPIIVYYQAEFAVLELHFTKLLIKEFHEKRGLIY